MKHQNLTVMFTDIRGFTEEASKRSREGISNLLDAHDRVTKSVVEEYQGKVVKNLGDGYIVTFESPTDALHAAVELHRVAAEESNELKQGEHFELKIALNSGEVILKNKDVFGTPVNISARVLGITPPNKVYLTDSVYQSINKNELEVSFVDSHNFKGIPYPVKVYRVGPKITKKEIANAVFSAIFSKNRAKKNFSFALIGVALILTTGFVAAAAISNKASVEGYNEVQGVSDEETPQSSESSEPTSSGGTYSGRSTNSPDSRSTTTPGSGQVQGTTNSSSNSQGTTIQNTSTPGATVTPTTTPTTTTEDQSCGVGVCDPCTSNFDKCKKDCTSTCSTDNGNTGGDTGGSKDKDNSSGGNKNNNQDTTGPPPQQAI